MHSNWTVGATIPCAIVFVIHHKTVGSDTRKRLGSSAAARADAIVDIHRLSTVVRVRFSPEGWRTPQRRQVVNLRGGLPDPEGSARVV